jgi:23S rRNA (pseudouridine1915-N3)-methyltransferase
MIRILAVGKLKDHRLADLAADYLRRLGPLAACEVVELKDQGPAREGVEMARRLGAAAYVVAMDERGDDVASVDLAALLGAHGSLSFLIGGADGLAPEVRGRADRVLRLSSLTLTHEWARVLLLEQVYRGLTILRGMPYHRA